MNPTEMNHIALNPLNPIFEQRKASVTGPSFRNRFSTGANGTAASHPPLPTSLVNENAQIGVNDSNLDDINLADADVHANP